MRTKIFAEKVDNRGKIYTFRVNDRFVNVLFLCHAIERAQKWQLSIEQIAEALFFPDEVLEGHFKRFIAHKIFGEHVLRAVYEYDRSIPAVVTVYFPYSKRYFKGGLTYEDKILK